MKQAGQDKSSEQQFYDTLFRTRKKFDQFQQEVYQYIAQTAREKTSGRIALDLGCGAGDQAVHLISQEFDVFAVDLSIEAVRLCKLTVSSDGKTVEALNADAENLPVKDGSIDACVCSLLLHHFKDFSFVATELKRVMRPGGVVIATDANAHNPFVWLFFNVLNRVKKLTSVTPNQRALRKQEIINVFREAGFDDFSFSSFSTQLKQDWLGDSFSAKLNHYLRKTLLELTEKALPAVSRGNVLVSVFQKNSK